MTSATQRNRADMWRYGSAVAGMCGGALLGAAIAAVIPALHPAGLAAIVGVIGSRIGWLNATNGWKNRRRDDDNNRG